MNGLILRGGAEGRRVRRFLLLDEDGAPITGAAPTVRIEINGVDAAGQGVVAEASAPGAYIYTLTESEAGTAGSGTLRPSAPGAIAAEWPFEIVPDDPYTSQAIAAPPNFEAMAIDAQGRVSTAAWSAAQRDTVIADAAAARSAAEGAATPGDVPSAASIASAVWAASGRTLTGFGDLAADVAGAVWGAASRTLTGVADSAGVTALLGRLSETWAARLDTAVSSRSTLTSADVRTAADGALEDYAPATSAQVAATQGAIIAHGDSEWVGGGGGGEGPTPGQVASAVWGASERTLTADGAGVSTLLDRITGPRAEALDRLDADVSSRATAADVVAARDAITAHGDDEWTGGADQGAVQAAVAAALAAYGAATGSDVSSAVAGLHNLSASQVESLVAGLLEGVSTFDPATDTVRADIRSINSVEVVGRGRPDDRWGPAA